MKLVPVSLPWAASIQCLGGEGGCPMQQNEGRAGCSFETLTRGCPASIVIRQAGQKISTRLLNEHKFLESIKRLSLAFWLSHTLYGASRSSCLWRLRQVGSFVLTA